MFKEGKGVLKKMQKKLQELLVELKQALASVESAETVQELKVKYLGKKGEITSMMKQMGSMPAEERPKFGQLINSARNEAEEAILSTQKNIEKKRKEARLKKEALDVTLPGERHSMGGVHPLTLVYRDVRDIFVKMGYTVMEGPEIEYDKYNLEMLNIPKDHPARDMQDTFYVSDDIVLRTHTSPVQVRTMLKKKPPIRMICPGRVYRSDDVDATHSPIFNQCEGLVIDKGISFGDLKGTLDRFLKEFFGEQTTTKFRPGYFPFTEPSAEVDASCSLCHGAGCPACKGAGMIEVLGCGMVNPHVLEMCGIDPQTYTGFAFGLGLDRLANIKYGITDIRLLYENDVRFIEQFK